ncbi:MAG: YdcF family protein [Phototrophicaceae bacterium]
MTKQKLSRSSLIGRFILILIIGWSTVIVGLIATIHYTGTVNEPAPSDAIVVLGAGLSRSGRPGYALTRRSAHAADLWQQGYADTIICTGGVAANQSRSEAEGCMEVLVRNGVPTSAILLENNSASTEENALYTQPILDDYHLNSIILVSDSYHLFRARHIFNTVGIADISLSPVSANLIRGYPSYESSLIREVLALHWQVFKTIFNIPITNL